MTLLAFPVRACGPRFSSIASRLGRLNAPPRSDRAPALRVSRRVSPSHRRRLLPKRVIIECSGILDQGESPPPVTPAALGEALETAPTLPGKLLRAGTARTDPRPGIEACRA